MKLDGSFSVVNLNDAFPPHFTLLPHILKLIPQLIC